MNKNNLISQLISGQIKLHKLNDYCTSKDQIEIRRTFLEKETGINLSAVKLQAKYKQEYAEVIENCFGAISIPLGIAGPMNLITRDKKYKIFIPIATT